MMAVVVVVVVMIMILWMNSATEAEEFAKCNSKLGSVNTSLLKWGSFSARGAPNEEEMRVAFANAQCEDLVVGS
jgi:hypothetical protein